MKKSGGYYVIVAEDLNSEKIIGSATLVIEQKFIHNCGLVCIFNLNINHIKTGSFNSVKVTNFQQNINNY
jgi:hypothetical protein